MSIVDLPPTETKEGRNRPRRDIRVYQDLDALSTGVAEEILLLADAAVREKGQFDLVLSGGRTPRRIYELLARDYGDRLPWPHVQLFWGDERYVPVDDSRSNLRMVREALIDRLALPVANVHAMPTNFPRPEEAARAYETELRKHFAGGVPAFDLVLLGVGPEGHTASLFPGSKALDERDRWVMEVRVEADPPERLTLTLPVLNQARNIFFLVAGKDKQPIVHELFSAQQSSSSPYPAALVQPAGRTIWFLDQSAHG
jgi:6-phosphogluconolactonase